MSASLDGSDHLVGLALAAGRGDRDAFAGLVHATRHELMRFLASLTTPSDVEDLTQETYLRVFGALPRFAGRSSVRTWLLTIARRVAVDHVRYITRRPRTVPLPDWQAGAESDDAPSHAGFDDDHALTDLVARLSDDRREAFVLTQLAGFTYAEAAKFSGCPVGTIRSRVARAREDLITAMHDKTPASCVRLRAVHGTTDPDPPTARFGVAICSTTSSMACATAQSPGRMCR